MRVIGKKIGRLWMEAADVIRNREKLQIAEENLFAPRAFQKGIVPPPFIEEREKGRCFLV